MIKISIVTPTYNNLENLKKNIESVYNQTIKNKEHIIVDNLSSDGTDIFVTEYIKKADYPVIYIRERDSGAYEAMNKGIKVARGKWIHILNSDDYYYSDSSLKILLEEDIEDFDVVSNSIFVKNEEDDGDSSVWIPVFNEKINHYNFPHTGMVIKKSFYEKHGYYNEKYKIISDAIFVLENLPRARYKIMGRPFVVMSNKGISNKLSWTRFYEGISFILFFYKGSVAEKIKYIFIDSKRDFLIFLRLLKKKIEKA